MPDYVQVRNPRSDRWVKIDRTRGVIVSHKRTAGPYKGVPQAYSIREPLTDEQCQQAAKLGLIYGEVVDTGAVR